MPRWSVVLGLLAALAACAPNGGSTAAGGDGGAPLLPSLQATTLGDRVRLVLQVTNTSGSPVPLEFSSGQTHDFAVLQGGREVWRWSADQMFTQALQSRTVSPGETLTWEAEWVPPAGLSGELTAVGTLTAMERPVEQRTTFRLP